MREETDEREVGVPNRIDRMCFRRLKGGREGREKGGGKEERV